MTGTPTPLRPAPHDTSPPVLRLVADDERRPPDATAARPVRVVVDGVPLLVACPPRAEGSSAAGRAPVPPEQPMLPLAPVAPPDAAIDLDQRRAEQWVAALAQAVCEVISRRRPAQQLRGTLDDDSLAMVAAWARLGTVQPRIVDRPRLSVVTPTRVESWVACAVRGRRLAVAVAMERRDGRWCCTAFRLLAPRALAHPAA